MTDAELEVTIDVVRAWTRHEFDEGPEADGRIEATPWGFTITRQSRAYLDTGDVLAMLIGSGPYVVDGESGEVWATGSDPISHSGDERTIGYANLHDKETFRRWRRGRLPGVGNVLDAVDPEGADARLLQRYARWGHLEAPFHRDGQFGWSDMETGRYIEPEGDRWALRSWSRGTSQDEAVFSHRDDALRALMIDLARPGAGGRSFGPRNPPTGGHGLGHRRAAGAALGQP
ncbi:YrhB domain-containing protein [Microbacterium kyungheense]|uniref:YrhB domain-containing protein n=1 Tax=Microbacterium kyungheense TaxID=1263636 RepID=UPI00114DCB05|nr:YrhB domain-containing protein [Microbacterium kyungheense]